MSAKNMLTAKLGAAKGKKCAFCLPTRGGSTDQPVFQVISEQLTTMICGTHLAGYLTQMEEQVPDAEAVNGQPLPVAGH